MFSCFADDNLIRSPSNKIPSSSSSSSSQMTNRFVVAREEDFYSFYFVAFEKMYSHALSLLLLIIITIQSVVYSTGRHCVCVRVCVRDYFIIPSKVVQKSEGEKRGLFLSLSLSLFHTNHNERGFCLLMLFFPHLNITRRRREI